MMRSRLHLMHAAEARLYSDALADVLCWFEGFHAAKPKAALPPGLDRLRDLNIMLKRQVEASENAALQTLRAINAAAASAGVPAGEGVRDQVCDAYVELTGEQMP